MTPEQDRKAQAAFDGRAELWVCPDCAFGFDVVHKNMDGSYTCPVCEADRLRAALSRILSYAKATVPTPRNVGEINVIGMAESLLRKES